MVGQTETLAVVDRSRLTVAKAKRSKTAEEAWVLGSLYEARFYTWLSTYSQKSGVSSGQEFRRFRVPSVASAHAAQTRSRRVTRTGSTTFSDYLRVTLAPDLLDDLQFTDATGPREITERENRLTETG